MRHRCSEAERFHRNPVGMFLKCTLDSVTQLAILLARQNVIDRLAFLVSGYCLPCLVHGSGQQP